MTSPISLTEQLETFDQQEVKEEATPEQEAVNAQGSTVNAPKISIEERRAISSLERILSIVASSVRMSYSLMCAYIDGHKWYMKETRSEIYDSLQKLLDVAFEARAVVARTREKYNLPGEPGLLEGSTYPPAEELIADMRHYMDQLEPVSV